MAASGFSAGSYSFAVTASAAGQPNGSSTVSNVYVEPVVGPTDQPVSPSSGTGLGTTFTFTVNSTNAPPDGTDVGTVWILFNTPAGGVNGANSCYFSLTPASNYVALVNNAGNSWAYSGYVGPGNGLIANSQCSIIWANRHGRIARRLTT